MHAPRRRSFTVHGTILTCWRRRWPSRQRARADDRVTNPTTAADSDEATLRAHLKSKGLKVGPIGRASDRQFSNFSFVIDDDSPSGTPSGAVVVGGKVFLKNARSNKTLGSLLKAARFLEARTYSVDDVLQLLTYFGAFTKAQQGLHDAVSKQTDRRDGRHRAARPSAPPRVRPRLGEADHPLGAYQPATPRQ